ncbi:MAG: hypothetical protein ACRDQZ_16695 [Mycobacteriales bacterium]
MDTVTSVVAGQAWEQGVDAQTLAETDRVGQNPAAAFEVIATRALAVWHAPGVLQRTCAMPAGPMPAAAVAEFCLTDGVVHGWDVARAIGRNVDIAAEMRIEAGSASDRLVAFLGRTP